MPVNDALLNIGANAMAAAATHAELFSAVPNGTGTSNNTTAGRAAITWDTAANGDMILTVDEAFTGGAAGGAVGYVGLWSTGPTGGTWYGYVPIPNDGSNDVTFNAAGEYTLTSLTITGTAS